MKPGLKPVGLVEELSPFRVRGWAFDPQRPRVALDLLLRIDGQTVMAFRPQLRMPAMAKYIGLSGERLGPVCFDISPPEWLADGEVHQVDVIVAATGTPLKALSATVQYRQPYLPLDEALARPLRNGHSVGRRLAPQVSVIVLNRNGSALLHTLLESWQRHNHAVRAEWVVIDHASADDTLEMLRHWRDRLPLRVKALNVNDSFSASCNLGARMARGRHLLFLNNDLIWQHDALPEMLRTLEDPEVGAVGLKLIKTAEGPNGQCWTEVQHLGVRFKQHDTGYRPYEAIPGERNYEAEHASQPVPAVTGAALLCRRADFLAVGGFDEGYFYGFEDVEFCLRLAHRLRKRVVCRNDLVALHRHGHTRLTGREAGIHDRIDHNGEILDRHVGLWSKRAWWTSLLAGDNLLCSEPLTIGLVVDQLPLPHGRRGSRSAQLADMLALGEQLRKRWPHARVLLLHPGVDPHEARGLHVLVVSDPHYDTAALRNARPDLRVVAWIRDRAHAWAAHPGWMEFDAYVAANRAVARSLQKLTPVPIAVHRPNSPLDMLDRWRAVVCLGDGMAGEDAKEATSRGKRRTLRDGDEDGRAGFDNDAADAARALREALKAAGVPCWLGWKDDAHCSDPRPDKVVEVCVYVCGSGLARESGRGSGLARESGRGSGLARDFDSATLNVVWRLSSSRRPDSGSLSGMTKTTVSQALDAAKTTLPKVGVDLVVDEMPTAALLDKALKERVGRTFSPS